MRFQRQVFGVSTTEAVGGLIPDSNHPKVNSHPRRPPKCSLKSVEFRPHPEGANPEGVTAQRAEISLRKDPQAGLE
jgi:hypothetical protein